MALHEEMRQRLKRFRGMGTGKSWPHETGMPGWSRSWHGYPCLHWLEMGFMPSYDPRQELDMLRIEAGDWKCSWVRFASVSGRSKLS